jgi:TolA-binding protein
MRRILFPLLLLTSGTPSLAQRGDAEQRLDKLEAQAKALQQEIVRLRKDLKARQPPREGRVTPPDEADTVAASDDPAEAAYMTGYNLWEQRRLLEAQKSLEAVARKYPKHRRASYARNLAGRAYLDEGKPATAAKLFLENYSADREGERAPDSLFYLGQALMKLNKPQDACRAYSEMSNVYGTSLRSFLKEKLPSAKAAARCGQRSS